MQAVPPPYPDEIFVSWFARIRYYILLPAQTANKVLCETLRYPFNIDFPSRLRIFVKAIQCSLTIEQIISEHTLLPYFEHFISKMKNGRILEYIIGDVSKNVGIGSFAAKSTESTRSPRICPLCAERDLKKFGEIYFHRVHQIPDILICVDLYSPRDVRPSLDKTLYDVSRLSQDIMKVDRLNFHSFDFSELGRQKGFVLADGISLDRNS